ENRLSTCNWQRVEGPDGTLGVLLQVVEKRCAEPFSNAIQDAEVQLKRLFNLIEDAAEALCPKIARNLLYFAITEKINIQLRTNQLQALRQRKSQLRRTD